MATPQIKAFYNEINPHCCAMLQRLMDDGLITAGKIDDRPIQDIRPEDVAGYDRVHWFAGIGGWDVALNLANWTGGFVWTGSCPCQPFSSAGKQKGKADERHLWPVWFSLIRESKPQFVFGEQVSSAIRHGWWDDVADDLEGVGYTTRAEVRPAISVGKPHKRDRLWFLGNAKHDGRYWGQVAGGNGAPVQHDAQGAHLASQPSGAGEPKYVADSGLTRLEGLSGHEGAAQGWEGQARPIAEGDTIRWLACPDGKQRPVVRDIRSLVDGLYSGASEFNANSLSQSEKEVRIYAASKKQRPEQVMREVWDCYAQEALWQNFGGFFGISQAEVLLPYLCQLNRRFDQGRVPSAITEIERQKMRSVWIHSLSSRASQGRGLHKQPPREHTDALHPLSWVLAQHAGQAFEALHGNAEAIRLVEHGVQHRAPILHAFGNAIVPSLAAEFIKATFRGNQ